MVVLDTSAASAVMHGIPRAIERLRAERPDTIVLVAPVVAEIHFGLQRLSRGSRRRRLLETEFSRLRALVRWEEWSEPAAVEFGRQKARLHKLGRIIEDFDIAIGAAAIAMKARLATLNIKHMERLVGLDVDDWS